MDDYPLWFDNWFEEQLYELGLDRVSCEAESAKKIAWNAYQMGLADPGGE